jgi:hypothetical protein
MSLEESLAFTKLKIDSLRRYDQAQSLIAGTDD